jgi:predicted transcriptional regulator
MTDKQAVMDAFQRLPENASIEEMAAELQIMKGVRKGRTDIMEGRTKTHDEAEALLQSWASSWNSR